MARKSRSEGIPQKNSLRWNVALYVRLSREDGDKEESESVANQKDILREFVSNEPDMDVFDVYIDDGWTGTNFDRPSFQRMLNDIKARKLNCVIVKDLSRFGRNYIDVGNYIEKVFPFMDIRFISINDYLDSYKNPQSVNTVMVPFKNLMNDEYCRDISHKVRSSLDIRRRNGKFVGSFACYGYLKDPNDHSKLVIDETAASVVQDIFHWFLEGMGIITIAKRLNAQGVLNPSAYKRSIGLQYRHPQGDKNDGYWPDSSVRRILTNKMLTGTLVQGKNKVKSYKVQICKAQPKEAWIEVENSHEAIIDMETFEKVQKLLQRDTRTAPQNTAVYLFAGFLKCADCKKAMNRRKNVHSYGTYVYYACSTFKKMSAGACTKHSIRHDRLERAVLATIQHQVQLAISMDEIITKINKCGKTRNDKRRLLKTLEEKDAEKQRIEKAKQSLYLDWKNDDLTKEEYHSMKTEFDCRIALIHDKIENIRMELDKYDDGVDQNNTFLSVFTKHQRIEFLTRELLTELVENIYVHEGGDLTIHFRFTDEYQRALEYIEQNADNGASA